MRVARLSAVTVVATAALLLAGCGSPGSGGGKTQAAAPETTGATGAAAAACAPVAGDKLVVLTDDKGLQNSDNIIPAVNKAAATKSPTIVDLLNSVSAVLDTPTLISLNKSVDIDRQTSSDVAKQFVQDKKLAATSQSGKGESVTVGAANFSESSTLAEIYGEVLKSAGFKVDVRTIGNRETYLPALEKGTISVVPEYAATLADFLNTKQNGANAASVASSEIDTTVAALTPLAEKAGLTVGKASAAQDQNAFAVTDKFATQHDVTTLSDLAAACGSLVLAGPAECPDRPFCQPGLEKTYGLKFSQFKSYDFGLIDAAILKGDAAIGLVLSSDGALAG
jgi:osmoprotectant transport system substrate-binding protein